MAADILTQNLVASFLLLSDCDASLSMAEVLERLDAWQLENDRHFWHFNL